MTDIYETSATDSSSSSVLSRIDGMTVCFEYKCIVFLFCTKTEILSANTIKRVHFVLVNLEVYLTS